MIIRINAFLFAIAMAFCSCHAQPPIWRKTKNWRVYAVAGQKIFSLSIDSLHALPGRRLDNDSVHFFIAKATIIPKERTPVWMGSYLSSYETEDGQMRKVEISTYGGFFYDESSGLYYVLPRGLSDEWLDYISNSITRLKSESHLQ